MYLPTSMSDIPLEVIHTKILPRLDGPTLASFSCTSSQLHSLSKDEALWANICYSTWPSTNHPCMGQLISEFPNGPFSFFSNCFPRLICHPVDQPQYLELSSSFPPCKLVSFVDIYYKNKPIFSRFQQTETNSRWFDSSSFQVDLLQPKDVVPMPDELTYATCQTLVQDLTMSWILVIGGQNAANLSSFRPVSVKQHPETGDIKIKYVTILSIDQEVDAKCEMAVTLDEYMDLCGVSMRVEDMDGLCLNGENSLKILHRMMERGERRKGRRGEGKRRYEKYTKRTTDRKRNNNKWGRRWRSVSFCAAALGSIFLSFWVYYS